MGSPDLAALEALTGTGLAARTASNAWALRTLTGTAAEITATNGDGAAGNPTLSLPAALTFTGKTVTGGAFTGGTINNASVGATTRSTGAFTTLGANGAVTLTAGTTSTSTTTGTLVVTGGVGISGAVNSGANGSVTASTSAILESAVVNTSAGTGARAVFRVTNDQGTACELYTLVAGSGVTGSGVFGVTRASSAELVTFGASVTSLKIGHFGANSPIVFGINNAEVARLTSTALTLASGINLAMSGASTLTTGTGAIALNGAVTCATTLAVTGVTTLSDNVTFSGLSREIRGNTSDGADNQSISVTSAGAASHTRGAFFEVIGNERASSSFRGVISITAGFDAGFSSGDAGSIRFNAGGAEKLRMWRSGGLELNSAGPSSDPGAGSLRLSGSLRLGNTAAAATPTATHTMTIVDGAGTTYRVLCVV